MKKLKLSRWWLVLCALGAGLFYHYHATSKHAYVNVYDWYGMLPRHILQQFEAETGIRVRYDMYDDNDMLEAKLLASNCGYDVVFPSASPYAARHIKVGLYQPLNKAWLPNLDQPLHPLVMREMKSCDPDMTYCIPYYWGTLGLLYDVDVVEPLLEKAGKPKSHLESYALLFDVEWLKEISAHGVSLLSESVDVFPAMLTYMGKSSRSRDYADLQAAFEHLRLVRPYIKRFSANRFIQDILLGEVCLAQAWSGEAARAIQMAKKMSRHLVYVVPREGSSLWIDAMAIPKGAPHPREAHIFINFLLRPDISAQLMKTTFIPTVVTKSYELLPKEIREAIFPKREKGLKLDATHLSEAYERGRARLWARIRLMR